MKKVAGIFAVVIMSIGMFSCQPESSVAETDALYENLDTKATDDDNMEGEGRG